MNIEHFRNSACWIVSPNQHTPHWPHPSYTVTHGYLIAKEEKPMCNSCGTEL